MASATRWRSSSLTIVMTRSLGSPLSLPTARGATAAEGAAASREAATRATPTPVTGAAAPGAWNDDRSAVASIAADATGMGGLPCLDLHHQQRHADEEDEDYERWRYAGPSLALCRRCGALLYRVGIA